MKLRNTLILLAVLVVLGGYVLLVERKAPGPAMDVSLTPQPTAMPVILSYDSSAARSVRVLRPAQSQRTELQFRDDRWQLTAPSQEEADQGRVIQLVQSLAALRPQRVLEQVSGTLADFELDPPAMTVEVELHDKSVYALKVGAQNSARSGYYGQVAGDDRIYLLPYGIGSDIERTLDAPPAKPTPTPDVAAPAGATPSVVR